MLRGEKLGVKASLLLIAALLSTGALAQSTSEGNLPTTTILGNSGLWKVFSADNLNRGQSSFGVWYDRINRNPGWLTISTVGVSGAVGITDWLEFGANFEINRRVLVRRADQLSFGQQALGLFGAQTPGSSPTIFELMPASTVMPQLRFPATSTGTLTGAAGYYNNFPWAGSSVEGNSVGTVDLSLKFNVLSEERGNRFGFAYRINGTIPTHRAESFLLRNPTQTGAWIIGTDLIFSKYVGELAELDLNAGFRGYISPEDARPMELSDEVPLGFGFVLPRKTRFQAMGELNAEVFVGEHTPQTTFGARDPIDATLGFRAFLTHSLALSAGYRRPVNQYGGDKNGFVVEMTFTTPPRPSAPPTINLTASADPSEVDAGQPVNLSAQGTSSDGSLLSYDWKTTGGQIQGSGANVVNRTDGLAPGSYSATVTATTPKGASETASAQFRVRTPPPPPQPPTISLSADRTRVQQGEIVNLTARGNSPDNRPLTYEWNASGGRVEATGNTGRFDTTGLNPGTYNIRAKVTDDRNLSAAANLDIAVTAPPPPPPPPPAPQPSKLNDCSFRASSARVDNVCKAKLDDVALRLRNEPDSTLVILGFADTRERNGARLSDSRANNAKAYLVREKGIADSRIQTRRGTPARGAEMRKVEIHLVPRGATFNVGRLRKGSPNSPAAVAVNSLPAQTAARPDSNATVQLKMNAAESALSPAASINLTATDPAPVVHKKLLAVAR